MKISDKHIKTSNIINYIFIIITGFLALFFYHFNYLLVMQHLPPMSPIAIIVLISTIVLVNLHEYTNEPPLFFLKVFSSAFVYLLLCSCLIGNLINGMLHPQGNELTIPLIWFLSTILYIVMLPFSPYLLFKLLLYFDKISSLNKINIIIFTVTFVLMVSISAFMNIDLNGGKYFYPRYIKAITLDAINNNEIKLCGKLSRTYYSKNYDQIKYSEGYRIFYSYPVVVSNTCLTTTKANTVQLSKKTAGNQDNRV